MPLVVVGIYDEVYEGEIAASLLRSAGIQSWLLGDQLAKFYPLKQRAWGGARLMVVEVDAADATAILDAARRGDFADLEPSDLEPPTGGKLAGPVTVLALFGGVETAWALAGVRRRGSLFRTVSALALILLVAPLVILAMLEVIVYFVVDVLWLVSDA